jgi:chemotaxis protein methyltransferase CheR
VTNSLDPQASAQFQRMVTRRLGLHIDESRRPVLDSALQRRASIRGLDVAAYAASLDTDPSAQELRAIAAELTVTETSFFRHNEQFQAFTQIALRERIQVRAVPKCLRFLSAGCSSGEEAYSLAILVREAGLDATWRVCIRAVDVNATVLQRAVRGHFTKWALRDTPPHTQNRWFRIDGDDVVIDESVRRGVEFHERNLAIEDLELWHPDTYDVVFCRNLLMYFTVEHAQALLSRIARALAPGGYLFLGHAESLRGLSRDFQLCHTHGTFYYRRKEESVASGSPYDAVRRVADANPAPNALVVNGAANWIDVIHHSASRIEALTTTGAFKAARASGSRAHGRPDLKPAHDLLQQERFADALDLVERLPSEAESDPDVLLLRALLLAHGGTLVAAEETCRRLLAVDDSNAGAHYILALCREGAGDQRRAAEHDQTATSLDPLFAMPRLHLGLLARRMGDSEAARRELGHALTLLRREDPSRLMLFGGGFQRETLMALCRAELQLLRPRG